MPAQFDVNTIQVIEFGVGLEETRGERYVLVAIDEDIRGALREMITKTRSALAAASDDPKLYEPSEKHAGKENLWLPLNHEFATNIRRIHEANNLDEDSAVLADPNAIFCYFARIRDVKETRLTAIRKATGFMGVLRHRSQFIRLLDNSLKLLDQDIFKLDRDFDLLVDGDQIHILRYTGFEAIGKLEDEIKKAVPANVKAISHDLPFVDFGAIEAYAKEHSRAARSLASVRQQKIKKIDQHKLKKACKQFDVQGKTVDGKLVVERGSIMDFLYLLDRRLYQIDLTDAPESYLAASRSEHK